MEGRRVIVLSSGLCLNSPPPPTIERSVASGALQRKFSSRAGRIERMSGALIVSSTAGWYPFRLGHAVEERSTEAAEEGNGRGSNDKLGSGEDREDAETSTSNDDWVWNEHGKILTTKGQIFSCLRTCQQNIERVYSPGCMIIKSTSCFCVSDFKSLMRMISSSTCYDLFFITSRSSTEQFPNWFGKTYFWAVDFACCFRSDM